MRHLAAQQPRAVGALEAEVPRVGRRQREVVRLGRRGARGRDLGPMPVAPAFAGQRRHRVDVDDAAHGLCIDLQQPVGGPGDHHAGVAVAAQDHAAQFLGLHRGHDIGHVVRKPDAAVAQVGAVADA
jgi:hypothetical protein